MRWTMLVQFAVYPEILIQINKSILIETRIKICSNVWSVFDETGSIRLYSDKSKTLPWVI